MLTLFPLVTQLSECARDTGALAGVGVAGASVLAPFDQAADVRLSVGLVLAPVSFEASPTLASAGLDTAASVFAPGKARC